MSVQFLYFETASFLFSPIPFHFISKQKEIKNILTTYFKNHLHIYKIHLSLQANKHLKRFTHELPYKTSQL